MTIEVPVSAKEMEALETAIIVLKRVQAKVEDACLWGKGEKNELREANEIACEAIHGANFCKSLLKVENK